MIYYYFLTALRSFNKERSLIVLNILGLSVAMAVSILIFQYVKYERSFDRFHSKASAIYRIEYDQWLNATLESRSAMCMPAIANELRQFPEVKYVTRLAKTGGVLGLERAGDQPILIRNEKAYFADSLIWKVFDFKLLRGNERTCLVGVGKVVLSKSIADQFLINDDPIGKTIILNDRDGVEQALEVSGVFDDLPQNSHLKFDFLVSYETLNARTESESETSWDWKLFYTYVLLTPESRLNLFQGKWNAHIQKIRAEKWEQAQINEGFLLQPLTSIHLNSNLLYECAPKEMRDGEVVSAFQIVAMFIVFIAWINYINMSTAKSIKRANEVAVRKLFGAAKSQLITQFLVESFFVNFAAAIIAVALTRSLWLPFVQLTGWDIPLSFLLEREFWISISIMGLTGIFISGLYPAILLSSYRPNDVLKGKVLGYYTGNQLRKILVVFQFTAAVVLITGCMMVYQQLTFMKKKELGINVGGTVVLRGPLGLDSLYAERFNFFKSEILNIPGIAGITCSSGIPGLENFWTSTVQRLGAPSLVLNSVSTISVDEDFIPQYQIKLKAGGNFSGVNDDRNVLLNTELANLLQYPNEEVAVGHRLVVADDTLTIIGILANFHQMSLRTPIVPLVIRGGGSERFFSVKMHSADFDDALTRIAQSWKKFFPSTPMDYFFLNDFFNNQYEGDERAGAILAVFTLIAIFIACLGLVGLSSFLTQLRSREVGIRKALGAGVWSVVLLLSWQFLQPVIIGIVIAVPVAHWGLDEWLETFAYHTHARPGLYLLSGLIVLIIAFVAVAFQTLKASLQNPVESLKHK